MSIFTFSVISYYCQLTELFSNPVSERGMAQAAAAFDQTFFSNDQLLLFLFRRSHTGIAIKHFRLCPFQRLLAPSAYRTSVRSDIYIYRAFCSRSYEYHLNSESVLWHILHCRNHICISRLCIHIFFGLFFLQQSVCQNAGLSNLYFCPYHAP